MRKKIIILALIFLLVASATGVAVVLTDKEIAKNYLRMFKQNREQTIQDTIIDIDIISDKECHINYYTEEIACLVHYKIITDDNSIGTIEWYTYLPLDSTLEQDNAIIVQSVRYLFENYYPIEEVKYVEREMKGNRLTIKKPK